MEIVKIQGKSYSFHHFLSLKKKNNLNILKELKCLQIKSIIFMLKIRVLFTLGDTGMCIYSS